MSSPVSDVKNELLDLKFSSDVEEENIKLGLLSVGCCSGQDRG